MNRAEEISLLHVKADMQFMRKLVRSAGPPDSSERELESCQDDAERQYNCDQESCSSSAQATQNFVFAFLVKHWRLLFVFFFRIVSFIGRIMAWVGGSRVVLCALVAAD